ncbi:hypothetical protein [[Clostridium] scindens]|uniref:hypothetical protein n=1 Tax=Clostridium scindens (strain JCM 10418 / VPI 12708) TaxID=29347 RepID=UPI0022DEBF42|nr:hypothetical protein [[Clostridium] scindens]WPB37442.1 hypothetical protein PBLEJBOC_02154 [[Clostridium] scindens]
MNASTPHDVVGKLPTARVEMGRILQGSGQDEESIPSLAFANFTTNLPKCSIL